MWSVFCLLELCLSKKDTTNVNESPLFTERHLSDSCKQSTVQTAKIESQRCSSLEGNFETDMDSNWRV